MSVRWAKRLTGRTMNPACAHTSCPDDEGDMDTNESLGKVFQANLRQPPVLRGLMLELTLSSVGVAK